MKDTGMDRDIALELLDELSAISAGLVQINDNEFVPHIITQPTDCIVEVGGTGVFTVVANNVKSYQWQFLPPNADDWRNIGGSSNQFSLTTQTYHYLYKFRCAITGKDNSVIYTNEVQLIEPEAQG